MLDTIKWQLTCCILRNVTYIFPMTPDPALVIFLLVSFLSHIRSDNRYPLSPSPSIGIPYQIPVPKFLTPRNLPPNSEEPEIDLEKIKFLM
ncbi:hypothetical protein M8J76_007190 [Diaphorina citri]|nr:hypothetical protein M8J76_007190 [Diaphorina citri]